MQRLIDTCGAVINALSDEGGEIEGQALNATQVKELKLFVGGTGEWENEAEISIGRADTWKQCVETGEEMPPGLYAWLSDMPEEGCVYLDRPSLEAQMETDSHIKRHRGPMRQHPLSAAIRLVNLPVDLVEEVAVSPGEVLQEMADTMASLREQQGAYSAIHPELATEAEQ